MSNSACKGTLSRTRCFCIDKAPAHTSGSDCWSSVWAVSVAARTQALHVTSQLHRGRARSPRTPFSKDTAKPRAQGERILLRPNQGTLPANQSRPMRCFSPNTAIPNALACQAEREDPDTAAMVLEGPKHGKQQDYRRILQPSSATPASQGHGFLCTRDSNETWLSLQSTDFHQGFTVHKY